MTTTPEDPREPVEPDADDAEVELDPAPRPYPGDTQDDVEAAAEDQADDDQDA